MRMQVPWEFTGKSGGGHSNSTGRDTKFNLIWKMLTVAISGWWYCIHRKINIKNSRILGKESKWLVLCTLSPRFIVAPFIVVTCPNICTSRCRSQSCAYFRIEHIAVEGLGCSMWSEARESSHPVPQPRSATHYSYNQTSVPQIGHL